MDGIRDKYALLITENKPFALQMAEQLESYILFSCEMDLEKAVGKIIDKSPDLVLLDFDLSGTEPLSLLKRLKKVDPHLRIILFSEGGDITQAVQAIKMGGADFLAKPVDPEKLRISLAKALREEQLPPYLLQNGVEDKLWLVHRSKNMRQFLQEVQAIAKTDADIVIESEIGLDQKGTAKLIHDNTAWLASRRFVALDLDAFSHEASEFHFWGTIQKLLQEADIATLQAQGERTGTLYLANFGRLSSHFQESLLTFLSSRKGRDYQGNVDKEIRVVIGLSRANPLPPPLQEAAQKSLLWVVIPPLRERREDIPLILAAYAREYAKQHNVHFMGYIQDFLEDILYYDWPGNMWEFQNLLELAFFSSRGKDHPLGLGFPDVQILLAKHIETALASDKWSLQEVKDGFEKELIGKLLACAEGDREKVAELLDLAKTLFERKLVTLDI